MHFGRHIWLMLGMSLLSASSALAGSGPASLSPAPSPRATAVSEPVLDQPADMQVHAGYSADQPLHATDADGDSITFWFNDGPPFMTVTTTDPGPGSAMGNVHLAPSSVDAGTWTGTVAAYDGLHYRTATFRLGVYPILTWPSNVTMNEGAVVDQTLHGQDMDGYPLLFSRVSGPTFMSVTTTGDSTGNLHLAPGGFDAGSYIGRIAMTDGLVDRQATVYITVNNALFPPVLQQPTDMTAIPGSITQQVLVAYDADLQRLTFSEVSGPDYMSLGPFGVQYAMLSLYPPAGADTGLVSATVAVSDGTFSDQKSFWIHVENQNHPPVIAASDLELAEGTDLFATVGVSDPDGQRLSAAILGAPTFMFANEQAQDVGSGAIAIPVRLLPTYADSGVYHPVVEASDLLTVVRDTMTITVHDADPGETSLLLHPSDGSGQAREYFPMDGLFTAHPAEYRFLSTSGPRADWTLHLVKDFDPGNYDNSVHPVGTLEGWDSAGVPLTACKAEIQRLHVERVRHRIDGSILSFWGTFETPCATGEWRYQVQGIPVTLTGPRWVAANTNQHMFFQVTARDTAHDAIVLSMSGLPPGSGFVDSGAGIGTVAWTPARLQFGDYVVRTVATTAGGLADTIFTTIHVSNADLAPDPHCNGPYAGTVGVPIPFTSDGTSDPDGDTLSYTWSFGDGAYDHGKNPTHAYATAGLYPVALVVGDGLLISRDATLATISEPARARAFQAGGSSAIGRPIQLQAGGGRFCVALELLDVPADIANLDPSSVRMEAKGLGSTDVIYADPSTRVSGDVDRDGAPDVTLCFAREDLRRFFSRVTGALRTSATVSFSLSDGHGFSALLPVEVVGPDGSLRVLTAPNPLRPGGTLSFFTSRAGAARLTLYDSRGRRVRTLLAVSSLAAGYHDIAIDGRSESGGRLPSGVYFYRLEAEEGTRSGRIAILR